ncbi:hypothetical protein BKA83DRAFT_4128970 [Pisolithus microcarpus]|nr:hypothetical protein BKA83DRAFT_4128970 [Pisolithus microcarpus]
MTFQQSFQLPHTPDTTFSQANEVLMTSFPMFMNGTYSHDSKQLSLLQEHAKLLEGQVVKLTIENYTLRTAFQFLAGAIGLCEVDPCQVDGMTFPQASTSPKSKVELTPPMPADYLGWVELAPPLWERLSASTRQFIHDLMESTYPHFKFANNGWKLNYLASNTYPAWHKGKLDDSGRWKQKKGKGLKIKDDDNDNEDNDSSDEIGRKWKVWAFKLEESGPETSANSHFFCYN